VINSEAASYQMLLQQQLAELQDRHRQEAAVMPGAQTTGLVVLRADELPGPELATLRSLARLRLQADGRPLHHHVPEWAALHEAALDERQAVACQPVGGAPAADAGRTALVNRTPELPV
jgi:cyclic beta-1,2-glucan synthetase